jgi:tRNA (guanine37-N1)-methyltransferase
VIRLESLKEESHWNLLLKKEKDSKVGENGLEYPHYTRPEVLEYKGKKYKVPKVLLSGNHKKIEEWRKGK